MSAPLPPALLERLQQAEQIVIFTGAGVSAESGVPTFRDAMTGLWSRYDPEQLATPAAFEADPLLVADWYHWRRHLVNAAEPNPAHQAIAALAWRKPQLTLITQNVDRLHQRAGNDKVLELHGSLHEWRCIITPTHRHIFARHEPDLYLCPQCGGRLRPGVVWFGESLPQDTYQAAVRAVKQAELLVSVGTSSLVYPAAQLPEIAKDHGAVVVQVNPQPTALDGLADYSVYEKAGMILATLFASAER